MRRFIGCLAMLWGLAGISASVAAPEPRLVTQMGHLEMCLGVAMSPTGQTIATVGGDATLVHWDRASGRELRRIRIRKQSLPAALTYSADGQSVFVGSEKGIVEQWDLASGSLRKSWQAHPAAVMSMALTPDGQQLLTGSADGGLRRWDARAAELLQNYVGHTGRIVSIQVSADGRLAASGSFDTTARVWDIASGSSLHRFEADNLWVQSVAFSPDGRRMAYKARERAIRIMDLASGAELATVPSASDADQLAFASSGRSLLQVADANLSLISVTDGALQWQGAARGARGMHLASKSQRQIWATCDSTGAVRAWREHDGQAAMPVRDRGLAMLAVATSVDGKTLVSATSRGFGSRVAANELHVWDLASGQMTMRLQGHKDRIRAVAISPDGLHLVSSGGREVILWSLPSGARVRNLETQAETGGVAFSPDGLKLMWISGKSVAMLDIGSDSPPQRIATEGGRLLEISPDGRWLAVAGDRFSAQLWDLHGPAAPRVIGDHRLVPVSGVRFVDSGIGIQAIAFNRDSTHLATGADDNTVRLWRLSDGGEAMRLVGHPQAIVSLAFTQDGNWLYSGGSFGTVRRWSLTRSTPQDVSLDGHTDLVTALVNLPGGRLLSGSWDGSLLVWDAMATMPMARLVSFPDSNWVVSDRAGRFDTGDLERSATMHWVLPEAPFKPAALESFMRDFYEPRLLPRILAKESFTAGLSLSGLNRAQPGVRLVGVTPITGQADRVRVEVEVQAPRDGEWPATGGIADLRLFRNGQLVGYVDGALRLDADGRSVHSFTVRLSAHRGATPVAFSAYAFNEDRIKSETARFEYRRPEVSTAGVATEAPTRGSRRAYVIAMGVNQHDSAGWDLSFAANDARAMRSAMSSGLERSREFSAVTSIELVSDGGVRQADKARLSAVLKRLAGKPLTDEEASALRDVRGSEELRAAAPDDLVFLSFAGHGFRADDGRFFLMSQDYRSATALNPDRSSEGQVISSDELGRWLRDVDAGDITLVVDACQSAASVQDGEFKPGPMGSRGLGQLAFDKGMRVLAASQSNQAALEHRQLQQGLLTYSLVVEGLQAKLADHAPKDGIVTLDEWLRYGVLRVPGLAREVRTGTFGSSASRGATVVRAPPSHDASASQIPALFDFARGRQVVTLLDP